jgi:S-adenosylmethionine-diacylglycerol 3-amino-3-carboxypropyl transferase
MSIDLFRSSIAFTITNEDHLVVQRALRITPRSRVLCIGSAGDTALNLLALRPERVTAVDLSFPQTCLQWLKAVGVRRLEPRDLHLLLGVTRSRDGALACYQRVRPGLPTRVRAFWDRRRGLISRGVLWQGTMIRLLFAARLALGLLIGRDGLRALQRCSTPRQGELFFRRYVDKRRTRLLLRAVLNRWTLRLAHPVGGGLPSEDGGSYGDLALEGLKRALTSLPVADNPYLFPFIFGRYPSRSSLPPYLNERSLPAIRREIDRLEILHADLLDHLADAAERSVDCFALSNVIDWMPARTRATLLSQVARVARPGARILALSRAEGGVTVPDALRARLVSNRELSAALLAADRSGYHRSVTVLEVPGG